MCIFIIIRFGYLVAPRLCCRCFLSIYILSGLTPPLRWPPVHRVHLECHGRLFGRARLRKNHVRNIYSKARKTEEIEWFFSCDTFTARLHTHISPHLTTFSFVRRVYLYTYSCVCVLQPLVPAPNQPASIPLFLVVVLLP